MKITTETLLKIAPQANRTLIAALAPVLNDALPAYDITTALRVKHFLAQAAHETAGFKTLTEYASGAAYEGRKDLGNTVKGDGIRFKGRGIFQITGRANYAKFGAKCGQDLVNNPELAAAPEVAVLTACEYWNEHGLSKYADADDIKTITKRINGGYNGLADRTLYAERSGKIVSSLLA